MSVITSGLGSIRTYAREQLSGWNAKVLQKAGGSMSRRLMVEGLLKKLQRSAYGTMGGGGGGDEGDGGGEGGNGGNGGNGGRGGESRGGGGSG